MALAESPEMQVAAPTAPREGRIGSRVPARWGWSVALTLTAGAYLSADRIGLGSALTAAGATLAWLLVAAHWVRHPARWAVLTDRLHRPLDAAPPWSVALALVALGLVASGHRRLPALLLAAAIVGLRSAVVRPTRGRDTALRSIIQDAPWALFLIGAGLPGTTGFQSTGLLLLGVGSAAAMATVWAERLSRTCSLLAVRVSWGRTAPSSPTSPGTRPRPKKVVIVTLLALAASALFLLGTARQVDQLNRKPENGHDQGSYLRYASDLHDSPDAVVRNRLEMPLYPYLISLVPGASGDWAARFDAALRISIAIALVGLVGVAAWSVWTAGWWAAGVATSLIGFTVFLFLGSWILADVLAALLFAGCLALMGSVLRHPGAIRGALFGALAGLTHLTKTIALLPLAITVLGCLVAFAWPRVARIPATRRWSYLASGSAAVFLFVLVIAPYAANSDRVYGSAMYNRVTTYYLWYDNFAEVESGTLAAGDQNHRPTLPADQIPSPAKYLRDHTLGEVAHRFATGWRMQWSIVMHGGTYEGYLGYGPSVMLLGATSLVAAATNAERVRARLTRDRLAISCLAAIFLAVEVAVMWWLPFGSGNRYLLPILLPAVALCVWTIHRGFSVWSFRLRGRLMRVDTAAFALLAVPVLAVGIVNAVARSGQIIGGY